MKAGTFAEVKRKALIEQLGKKLSLKIGLTQNNNKTGQKPTPIKNTQRTKKTTLTKKPPRKTRPSGK